MPLARPVWPVVVSAVAGVAALLGSLRLLAIGLPERTPGEHRALLLAPLPAAAALAVGCLSHVLAHRLWRPQPVAVAAGGALTVAGAAGWVGAVLAGGFGGLGQLVMWVGLGTLFVVVGLASLRRGRPGGL